MQPQLGTTTRFLSRFLKALKRASTERAASEPGTSVLAASDEKTVHRSARHDPRGAMSPPFTYPRGIGGVIGYHGAGCAALADVRVAEEVVEKQKRAEHQRKFGAARLPNHAYYEQLRWVHAAALAAGALPDLESRGWCW